MLATNSKVAIFYSGLIRSYPDIYKTIENIIDINQCKFYFHTWEGQDDIQFLLDSRDWEDYLIEKPLCIEPQVLSGLYSKYKAFCLVPQDIDYVIYSRFDNYYWPENQHIKLNNYLNILPYSNWTGIEDRFAFGAYPVMQLWSSCFVNYLNHKMRSDTEQGEVLLLDHMQDFLYQNIFALRHCFVKTSICQGYNKGDILKSERCTPQFTGIENVAGMFDCHLLYKQISRMGNPLSK